MSFRFASKIGLIRVDAEIVGPSGRVALRLALDTGANQTAIKVASLKYVGCDPASTSPLTRVTTSSGVVHAPSAIVTELRALGEVKRSFLVLAQTLPPSAGVDGLLGLDFFRDRELRLDFRHGLIDLV